MGDVVKYDPAIIMAFAMRLYARARSIVILYTVVGLIAGGMVGFSIAFEIDRREPSMIIAGVGALFIGALAFALGQEKAFALKLMAQTALCQVQIETNTRTAAAHIAAGVA